MVERVKRNKLYPLFLRFMKNKGLMWPRLVYDTIIQEDCPMYTLSFYDFDNYQSTQLEEEWYKVWQWYAYKVLKVEMIGNNKIGMKYPYHMQISVNITNIHDLDHYILYDMPSTSVLHYWEELLYKTIGEEWNF